MITNQEIDYGRGFDWGLASADYAKYRDIYPDEFYRRIAELGCCIKSQKVLDLGTGTGVLPRNMSQYGAEFVGTDISENQIRYAKLLSEQAGLSIDYLCAAAEDLDFPDASFDVVTACQCFMYFDKAVLLPKIHRFLKENGHFLILFMAWLPYESEIARESEKLVLKYNPEWTGGGMKRYELKTPDWSREWFTVDHAITYDIPVVFTRESWHGRIRACRGIGASSLSEAEIAAWEKEHPQPEAFFILYDLAMSKPEKKQCCEFFAKPLYKAEKP